MARYQPIKIAHRVFEAVGGSDKNLPPVVFMHAMLCSKEIWETIPQRVANATRRKVYAYDARNHGESEHTKESSFDHNLGDLYTFMDQMKINNSILVGHSMGGMTAITAALQEPLKVEKAFIVDMYVKKIEQEMISRAIRFMKTWTEVVRSLPKETLETDVTRISVPLLYERLPADMKLQSEKEAYLMSKFVYKRRPDGGYDMSYNTEALTEALKQYEQTPLIQSGYYDGPAYFIYGSKSPYNVGSEEEDIMEYFPNAEMIRFEDASHHVFVDFPDLFADTLIQKILKAN